MSDEFEENKLSKISILCIRSPGPLKKITQQVFYYYIKYF